MGHASPQLRNFARRLMAHEASGNEPGAAGEHVFPVLDALRPALLTLMGRVGFRGLLSRSIAAASDEVRWLRAVHVKSDGALTGLLELRSEIEPALFLEGRTVMLARLLGLLVALIGPELTLQLVRETWPKLPLKDLDLGKGDTE